MARTPPRIAPGKLVTADAYNVLRDWVLELMTIRVGPGLQMTRATGGTFISLMHSPQNQLVAGQTGTGDGSQRQWFFARINSSTLVGPSQWEYTFAEVRHTTGLGHGTNWTVKSDGITGSAYNTIEHMHTGTGFYGNGVDSAQMSEDFPYFTLQPVPDGCIVIIYIYPIVDANEYWFQFENSVDGSCSEEE